MKNTAWMALAAVTVGAVMTGCASATEDKQPAITNILQRDADLLLDYGAPGILAELDTPSGPVAVRSGFGDVAAGTPVPWDAKFRIGSFTKPFVSATLLTLVGEGRLSLDDTVDRWLPGVVKGNGNDGRKVTVRHLLQHTSGIPEYVQGLTYLFTRDTFEKQRLATVTPQQAVALAMTFKPDFAPGTRWNYSNTNYVLAGMIIESVTGTTWQQAVIDRVLVPLDLRDTYLPDTSADIPTPHAVGYERFSGPGATREDPKYGEPIDATTLNPSWGGAAGEIISTTDDSNKFLRALVRGEVMPPAQLAEMQKTVPTSPEFQSNWPGAQYGLGLVFIPNSCGGSWAHGGDIQGFMTRNGVTPDGSRSVIVTINTDSPQRKTGLAAPTRDITTDLIDHALCHS
ncbi:serine hydrolase domain-containing protein [Micromonospora sp. 067-2]|uniref:serine hydrolase domain-containing protein n=1 Tax=Micromonospora sp. 067-2 TaxID=2789270 RepID=UPI00397B51D3